MKYNGIVERKLLIIEEKINLIESWQVASFSMLQENLMLQNAVEHALQVAIEAAIDTAERVLAIEKQTPPLTSVDAMEKLQKLGIIPANPAYIEMVKFRNFIMHRYEKIDLAIVYATIKNKLPVFKEFVNAMRCAK